MMFIVEKHIEAKVKIAEWICLYGENTNKESLREKLALPETTFQRYYSIVDEVYRDIAQVRPEGYTSKVYEQVVKAIVKTSVNVNLLYDIIRFPKEDISFYCKRSNISVANFYRRLKELNQSLKQLDCEIQRETKGFFLTGKSEWYIRLAIVHLGHCFSWEVVQPDKVEQYLLANIQNKKKIYYESMGKFEKELFIRILSVFQDRVSQGFLCKCKDEPDDIISFLENIHRESEQVVDEVFIQINEDNPLFFGEQITRKNRLRQVLVHSRYQIKLYPYNLSDMPMRRRIFVKQFEENAGALHNKVTEMLHKISEYLDIDLMFRYNSIVYLIVTSELLVFKNDDVKRLIVHSDFGGAHQSYLVGVVRTINHYFDNRLEVVSLDGENSKYRISAKDLFITNEWIPTIPEEQQIIVKDFVSLIEYSAIVDQILKYHVGSYNNDLIKNRGPG